MFLKLFSVSDFRFLELDLIPVKLHGIVRNVPRKSLRPLVLGPEDSNPKAAQEEEEASSSLYGFHPLFSPKMSESPPMSPISGLFRRRQGDRVCKLAVSEK